MAIKKVGLGGFGVSLTASDHEAGLHFSLGGPLWRRLVRRLRERHRYVDGRDPAHVAAAVAPALPPSKAEALAERIGRHTWYHTFDFGNGVRTPGAFDFAPILHQYNFPARLDGKRVLDVATYDGYWAFEFERRGAREVVALDLEGPKDLDWPPARRATAAVELATVRYGEGFAIAREQLGSSARRVVCDVYHLTPEKFGTFDVVHSGDLLPHLSNPIRALQNIAAVCTEYALISDVYFPDLDHQGTRPLLEYRGGRDGPTWWRIGFHALREMILDAGFSRVDLLSKFTYGYRDRPGRWQHAVFQAFK